MAVAQPGVAAGLRVCTWVWGWHAEEAAYQQTEGLQLAHFLCPVESPDCGPQPILGPLH